MSAVYTIGRVGSTTCLYTVRAPAGQLMRACVLAERLLAKEGVRGEDGEWDVHGLGESMRLYPDLRARRDAMLAKEGE